MKHEKQCWTCIYGENRSGSIDCMHSTIRKLRHKPDPYDCEFYEPVSDDYMADMKKVAMNT